MKRKLKKLFSVMLSLAMALSLFGGITWADGEDAVYVVMNIPYADFYAAEITNDVEVDVVSSSTSSKWSRQSGTYYEATEEGGTILGVTYSVKTTAAALEAIGAAAVEGTADDEGNVTYDLSSAGDYAYYVVEEGTYSYYKELTAENGTASFGAAVYESEAVELNDATYEFSTSSRYGDYQLNITSSTLSGTVYGVIIETAEGTSYGLRALENIWRSGSQLSWAVNADTYESHGNLLSYEHYASIVGQTITKVTYLTSDGTYYVTLSEKVVAVSDAAASAEDVALGAESVTVTITDLPEDFIPVFTIDDEEIAYTVNEDGAYVLAYTASAIGSISVTVSDAGGEYASISASFTVSTETAYAQYDSSTAALVAADGVSDEDFAAYIAAISAVSVNGTSYSTSGRNTTTIINDDGSINADATASSGMGSDAVSTAVFEEGEIYEITVSATGYPDLTFLYSDAEIVYVVMNIPYADFYAAEITNDVEVDAVSSSTSSKWSRQSGTYYEATEEGGTILGVYYSVATTAAALEAIGAAAVEGTADDEGNVTYDLSSAGDYAYYVVEEGTYSYYKILTADEEGTASFSAASYASEAVELNDATYEFSTSSRYGDYQLNITSSTLSGTVYGVIIETAEGTSYGLRALENIWRSGSQLSWAVNADTYESHGNLLSYEHYASIVGQTITKVTYLTSDGTYYMTLSEKVVAVSDAAASAEDVALGAESVTVTITDLPEDFVPVFTIDDEEIAYTVNEDGAYVLAYTASAIGSISVTVSDAGGEYASISASFTVSTETAYGVYDEDAVAIVAAEGISEEDFAAYIAAISTVTVNGTSYSTSGRNSTTIINSDGSIATDATVSSGMGDNATTTAVFEEGTYTIVVSATGYPDLTFELTIAGEEAEEVIYVLMNIPYADFYAAELDNDVEVDSVSSATNNKWSAQSGTYYEAAETGGTILGVSYPVMTTLSVLEALGATEVDSEDALAEAGDYAYYVIVESDEEDAEEETEDDTTEDSTESEGPGGMGMESSSTAEDYDYSYYKILIVTDGTAAFSAAVYEDGATELTDASVSLSSSSQYGDYQLNVSSDTLSGTVFGVIITAVDEEGNTTDYGLRALENIWRSGSQLSWSVGYSTTEKHGNTLSYDHYASMEGSTITTITYITSEGLYTISDLALEVTGASENSDSDSEGLPDGDSGPSGDAGGPDESNDVYEITAVKEDGTVSMADAYLEGTAEVGQLPDGNYIVTFSLTETGIEYITSMTINGTEVSIGEDGSITFTISSIDGLIPVSAYVEAMSTTTEFYLVLSEAAEEDGTDDDTAEEDYIYVIMNIPYAEFYAAELDNDVEVDSVSSATSGKWQMQDATYYEATDEGGTILGVTFPVKTTQEALDALGATAVDSEDALAEAGDYAYYVIVESDGEDAEEETEDDTTEDSTESEGLGGMGGESSSIAEDYDYSYYKVLTVTDGAASFSEAVYENVVEITDATVEFSTSSQYGDYQLNVSSDTLSGTVFGVIITTVDDEGNTTDYGLRALENIWRSGSQLSWSVGISTTEKHGNTLSYAHYESMAGQTIVTITYLTSDGLYTIDVSESGYVVDGASEDSEDGMGEMGDMEGGPDSSSGTTYTITAVSAEDGETISMANAYLEGTATVDQLPDGTTYIINFDLTEEGAEYITSITVNGTEATISNGSVTFDVTSIDEPILVSAYVEPMATTVEFYLVLSEVTDEDGSDDDADDGTDDDTDDGTGDDTDDGTGDDADDGTDDGTGDGTTPPDLPGDGGTGEDTDDGTGDDTDDGTGDDTDDGTGDDSTGDDAEDGTGDGTTPPDLPDEGTEDGTGDDTEDGTGDDTDDGTSEDGSDDDIEDGTGDGTTPPDIPDEGTEGEGSEDGTGEGTEGEDAEGEDAETPDEGEGEGEGTDTPEESVTLEEAVEAAEEALAAYEDAIESMYTGESWTIYAEAVAALEAFLADESATAEDILAATAAVLAAYEALVAAEGSGTEGEGTEGEGTEGEGTEGSGTEGSASEGEGSGTSDDDTTTSDDDTTSSDDDTTSSDDDTAEVGDFSNLALWMVLAALALISLAGASIRRRFN